eukprot:3703852-Amphidinium_carterae.1
MTLARSLQAGLSGPHSSILRVVLLRPRDKAGTLVQTANDVHFLAKCKGNFFASSRGQSSACISLNPTGCQVGHTEVPLPSTGYASSRPFATSAKSVPWMSAAIQGGSKSPGEPGPLRKRQNRQA